MTAVAPQRSGSAADGPAGGGTRDRRLPGRRPLGLSRIERNGLRPGTPAPPFALPDARGGGPITLESFRGRPLLLVFTDPHCAPCDGLAPRLARWRAERGAATPAVLLIGRGDPAENLRVLDAGAGPAAGGDGVTFPVAV